MSEVVYTADLPAEVEAELGRRFAARKLRLQQIGTAAFVSALGDARAIVVIPGDPVDAALIEALPASMNHIASYSTGLDHVDRAAAAVRGITVSGTPDVLTDATADIAILLILGAMRGAGDGLRSINAGRWTGWTPSAVFGVDLRGKMLGIAGAGRIGVATASRARAFGMTIAYWGRRTSLEMEALGATGYSDWLGFLSAIDTLSLHLPSTAQTRGLVDARALHAMRRGSYLVNTARGDLVDDEAVIAALASGQLAGVGLDVFSGEPRIHPGYHNARGVFALPHLGSATVETRAQMGASVIASLSAALGRAS